MCCLVQNSIKHDKNGILCWCSQGCCNHFTLQSWFGNLLARQTIQNVFGAFSVKNSPQNMYFHYSSHFTLIESGIHSWAVLSDAAKGFATVCGLGVFTSHWHQGGSQDRGQIHVIQLCFVLLANESLIAPLRGKMLEKWGNPSPLTACKESVWSQFICYCQFAWTGLG